MTQANERALKMLSIALEMEEKGRRFYERAVSESGNDLGREIFARLRDDEIVHVDRIKAIYGSLEGGGEWSEEWKRMSPDHGDLGRIFRDLAKQHGPKIRAEADDVRVLNVGIELEAAAVDFYQEHLEKATDPAEREFCEKMIAEERGHHRVLSDMEQYLADPAAFFMELEHSGLDG